MPYIKQEDRNRFDEVIREYEKSIKSSSITMGQLNYLITSIINVTIKSMGGISYSTLNNIIGVLECIKLELYRRIVVPYEDNKIKENGDVTVNSTNNGGSTYEFFGV